MEDRQIVELLWSRDSGAISALAGKYGGLLGGIARGILEDERDAEECVNDTYLAAWNSIPPHRPQILSAFLAKIVRENAFNSFKRSRALKRGGGQTAAVLDELSELISGGPEPEAELDAMELSREIDSFLSSLPRDKRRMFVRRYFYADSVADIARSFGMSENRAAVTLDRLRERLRRHLTERGFEL